jgi:predicted aspartyl protease
MGLTHVTVSLRVPGSADANYDALFLVDTGATDSMASRSELARAGIRPVGSTAYELADGTVDQYEFGLAQIEFMGEVTAGFRPVTWAAGPNRKGVS